MRKLFIPLLVVVLFSTLAVQPTQAQSTIWTGEYFNNLYLMAPSAFQRQDGALAFNWGTASPDNRLNADNFSIRWGADPYFAAGTYRFWALADDYLRLNVGYAYHPQINTLDNVNHLPGQLVYADVTLNEGVHHIQVDYQEYSGNAFIFVSWANLASNPSTPNFPISQPIYTNVYTGGWTAQYYSNTILAGNPSLITSESSPTHYWSGGSPASPLPVDNFSARWSSTYYLDGGSYQLNVKADDGVRVYVDGTLMVNEWHAASGVLYTVNLNLWTGQHTFIVDYYEAAGDAYIDYSLNRLLTFPPVAPIGTPSGQGGGLVTSPSWVTVLAYRLNVRDNPSPTANILLKISSKDTCPVIGKNSDGSWYQIMVNGVKGWVSARFVRLTGSSDVPVTATAPPLAAWSDTGYEVTALTAVNIRNLPSTRGSAIIALMPRGTVARLTGRTANNSWWQVNYQGVTGWVSSTYAQIQPGAEIARIPVTG